MKQFTKYFLASCKVKLPLMEVECTTGRKEKNPILSLVNQALYHVHSRSAAPPALLCQSSGAAPTVKPLEIDHIYAKTECCEGL